MDHIFNIRSVKLNFSLVCRLEQTSLDIDQCSASSLPGLVFFLLPTRLTSTSCSQSQITVIRSVTSGSLLCTSEIFLQLPFNDDKSTYRGVFINCVFIVVLLSNLCTSGFAYFCILIRISTEILRLTILVLVVV